MDPNPRLRKPVDHRPGTAPLPEHDEKIHPHTRMEEVRQPHHGEVNQGKDLDRPLQGDAQRAVSSAASAGVR
jgi:hypothetical protein